MIAQTGDEWSSTAELVEQHVLPLLREQRVRLVEVARAGPREHDGIVVLQDTRTPHRLHADADEHGPGHVLDKQRPSFATRWAGHAPHSLLTQEQEAAEVLLRHTGS